MCRYNIAVDDALMEEVRPHIGENVAVQSWLEEMLRKALEYYLEQMVTQKDRAKEREQVLERVKELEKRSESTPYFPIMNPTPTYGEIWGIF